MASIQNILLDDNPCLELNAGDFTAILAPSLGNNILRMRNNKEHMEIFRYDEEHPYLTAKENPEIYGFPFLYLPNRLEDGILKVSDATYHLPVNEPEPYYTCLHGFLHKRSYQVIEETVVDEDTVKVVSQYEYNENDEIFDLFPVAFTIQITYTLSATDGLLQQVRMQNLSSDRMLPCGFCSHTCFQAPFADDTNADDYIMQVPVEKRWEVTPRILPTGKLLPLSSYDEQYNEGSMKAVHHKINNDLFSGTSMTLHEKPFHGMVTAHVPSGRAIGYEVSLEFQFWCMWNDGGFNGYYCPEPLTWMINAPNITNAEAPTGYTEIAPGEEYTCWQRIFTTTIH